MQTLVKSAPEDSILRLLNGGFYREPRLWPLDDNGQYVSDKPTSKRNRRGAR